MPITPENLNIKPSLAGLGSLFSFLTGGLLTYLVFKGGKAIYKSLTKPDTKS